MGFAGWILLILIVLIIVGVVLIKIDPSPLCDYNFITSLDTKNLLGCRV